jgi:polyhydroxyalkanoate synthesis regulator phasin
MTNIDPRLVHWGYRQDQYDITYIENEGQQEEVKTLKEDAELQPEGVQYDRLTVLLIQEMKALKAKVDSLEAEVQTLKNK